MTQDYSSFLFIHKDSAGSLLGSLLILCFSLFLFFQAKIFQTDKLTNKIIALQAALLVYLVGYTVYASSRSPVQVLIWTRVCYTGTLLVAITGLRFSSALHDIPHRTKSVLYGLPLLLIITLWIPGDHYFTHVLNPAKTHSSLIKGEFFPYLIVATLAFNGFLIIRTGLYIFRNREEKNLHPLIIGLTGSFLFIGFYGIVSALFSLVTTRFWIGAVFMAYCLTWYAQKQIQSLKEQKEELKEERDHYYNDLIHDSLTGVFTRDYLWESLSQCISQLRRNFRLYALIYIDMDDLKLLNDRFGHDTGDEILRILGQVLQEQTRDSDIPARIGGDEFLLLMIDCPPERAEKAAQCIRNRFIKKGGEELSRQGMDISLTLSMGILCSRYWEKDQEEIIHRADLAMYTSKKEGKNRITLYTPALEAKTE